MLGSSSDACHKHWKRVRNQKGKARARVKEKAIATAMGTRPLSNKEKRSVKSSHFNTVSIAAALLITVSSQFNMIIFDIVVSRVAAALLY